MKKLKGVALVLATVLTAGTVAGCGKKPQTPQEPQQPSVEWEYKGITGYKTIYEVGEQFSLNGTVITLKEKNGTQTQTITITNNMLKEMPDLSTEGDKNIVVIYNGKEYTYTINVVDTKKQIVQRFLKYLQKYQSGDISSADISTTANLVARFLDKTQNINTTQSGTLSKDEINSNSNLTQDQKELAKTLFTAITDALAKSGLDVTKSQIGTEQIEVNVEKLISALVNSTSSISLEDKLFYAMFPQGITEFSKTIANQISDQIGIINLNSKEYIGNIVKKIIIAFKEADYSELTRQLDEFFMLATDEEICSSSKEMKIIEEVYRNAKQNNYKTIISSILKKDLELYPLSLIDEESKLVESSPIKQYIAPIKNSLIAAVEALELFVFGQQSYEETIEKVAQNFSTVAHNLKIIEENNYECRQFIRIYYQDYCTTKRILLYSYEYQFISSVLNTQLSLKDVISNLFVEDEQSYLIIEKILFKYVFSFVGGIFTESSSNSVGGTASVDKKKQEIENVSNILEAYAKYLKVLSANNEEDMVKFISELADNEVYYENYKTYGTPYYLSTLIDKNFATNEAFDVAEKAVAKDLAKHFDELILNLKQKDAKLDDTLNALATFGQKTLENFKTYEITTSYYAELLCNGLSTLNTELSFAEKIEQFINNSSSDIYDVMVTLLTDAIGADFVPGQREQLYDDLKTNIELLLSGEDLTDFKLFNSIAQNYISHFLGDSSTWSPEEEEAVDGVRAFTEELDKFVAGKSSNDALLQSFKENLPKITKFIPNEIFSLFASMYKEFGIEPANLINGALNSDDYKDVVVGLLEESVYQIVSNLGLESSILDEDISAFTETILNSTRGSAGYDITTIKAYTIVDEWFKLLSEKDVDYNADVIGYIKEIINHSTGSVTENFDNLIKNQTKREDFAEKLAEIIAGACGVTNKTNTIKQYLNELFINISEDNLSPNEQYEKTIELLKNVVDSPEYVIFVETVVNIIKEFTNDQINYTSIKNHLQNFRNSVNDSERYIPIMVDNIINVLSTKPSNLMELYSESLKIEEVYEASVYNLTGIISVMFFDGTEDINEIEIIDTYFSKAALNKIKQDKQISYQQLVKYYFDAYSKVEEHRGNNVDNTAINFVLEMIKFDSSLGIKENTTQNFKNFIKNNKKSIVDAMVDLITDGVDSNKRAQALIQATNMSNLLLNILTGESEDFEGLANAIKNYSENFSDAETETIVYAVGTLLAVMIGDTNIDYNKIFAFIELPDGVSVDYNVFMQKLISETTWQDCITIEEFNYVVNENSAKDNFVSETYYLKLNINFDVQIAKLQGDLNITLTINN